MAAKNPLFVGPDRACVNPDAECGERRPDGRCDVWGDVCRVALAAWRDHLHVGSARDCHFPAAECTHRILPGDPGWRIYWDPAVGGCRLACGVICPIGRHQVLMEEAWGRFGPWGAQVFTGVAPPLPPNGPPRSTVPVESDPDPDLGPESVRPNGREDTVVATRQFVASGVPPTQSPKRHQPGRNKGGQGKNRRRRNARFQTSVVADPPWRPTLHPLTSENTLRELGLLVEE